MVALAIFVAACNEDPVSLPPLTLSAGYDLVWRDTLFSAVTRPVVDDSNAYFLDDHHFVTAVDKRTGRLRWRTQFTFDFVPGFRPGSGMTIAGGKLVVGDVDVFGLDPRSGAISWRFAPKPLGQEQAGHSHLTSDGTTVYTGSVSGRVYALDAASGVERWRAQVTDSTFVINDPILADGVIYVALSMRDLPFGGGVAAVRAADGQRLWLTQFPSKPQGFTGVETGVGVSATMIFAGAQDDRVVALDRQTGSVRLSLPGITFRFSATPAPASGLNFAIAGSGQTVVVGSPYGMVVGLDGADATVRWKVFAHGPAVDLTIVGDRAYLAALSALDVLRVGDGANIWSVLAFDFPVASTGFDFFWAAPAVDDERVYLGGDHGLYAFKKR